MKIAHLAVLVLGLSACGTVTAADTSPDAGGDVRGAGGSATGGSAGLALGGSTGSGGATSETGGTAGATGGSAGSGGAVSTGGGPECNYTLCGSPPGCVDTAYDANNCGSCGHVCGFGKLCVGATCVDGPGTGGSSGTGGGTGGSCSGHLCSGACVNTSSDRLNCGSCGVVCTGAQTCTNGACGS